MRDFDLLGAPVGIGAVPPVPFAFRSRLDFHRPVLLRRQDHISGLLGGRAEQQLPKTLDRRALGLHQFGQVGVGFGQRLDPLVVVLAERRLGAVQQSFQLVLGQLDDLRVRRRHGTCESTCRKRRHNG